VVGTLAGWRVGSKWLSWAKGSEGPSTEKNDYFFLLEMAHSSVRCCGQGPAYSGPSAETVDRSNALPQKRGGELVGVCECVRDVQGEEG